MITTKDSNNSTSIPQNYNIDEATDWIKSFKVTSDNDSQVNNDYLRRWSARLADPPLSSSIWLSVCMSICLVIKFTNSKNRSSVNDSDLRDFLNWVSTIKPHWRLYLYWKPTLSHEPDFGIEILFTLCLIITSYFDNP